MIVWLREDPDPMVTAVASYGYGFDDVVVEWREGHPVADRTPCSNPSTWAVDSNRDPVGAPSLDPALAGGCASVSWDRSNILDPETALELTVIDVNAQFGPDGTDQPDGAVGDDDQAKDADGDGLAELIVKVFTDVDLVGETFVLEQAAFASPVYSGAVRLSTTKGKSSSTDGILFIQENRDGNTPVGVTAQYTDADINVAGAGLAVPCPDNPLQPVADTRSTAAPMGPPSASRTLRSTPATPTCWPPRSRGPSTSA